jgi:putative transposase
LEPGSLGGVLNHYHFVAHSPVGHPTAESLRDILGKLHGKTAKWVNRLDGVETRKVWHNYRETRLTYDKSYFAAFSSGSGT